MRFLRWDRALKLCMDKSGKNRWDSDPMILTLRSCQHKTHWFIIAAFAITADSLNPRLGSLLVSADQPPRAAFHWRQMFRDSLVIVFASLVITLLHSSPDIKIGIPAAAVGITCSSDSQAEQEVFMQVPRSASSQETA